MYEYFHFLLNVSVFFCIETTFKQTSNPVFRWQFFHLHFRIICWTLSTTLISQLNSVHVGFWHGLPGKMNLNHLCHNVHIAYFQKTCLFWKIVFLIFQHKSQFHRFYDHLSTKITAWIALEIIFSTKKLVELLDSWNLNWFHAEYKRYLILHDSQTHLHVLSINNFSANFLHELSKLWSFLATVNFGITILKVFLAFLRPLWYALITKLRIL